MLLISLDLHFYLLNVLLPLALSFLNMSTNIQNCSVILNPCTPNFKRCYVSLERCKIENESNNNTTPKLSITAEPCTPNVEPTLATELRRAITEKNVLTTKTKSKFISALNELEKDNAETRRQQRKEKAMREVIDSEIAYQKQLENILKYFKDPLANGYILSAEEIEKVFGKLTTLFNINKELLNIMNECPTNIAQAFKKVAPYFKMYSTYAYEYKMISNFLQVLETKNGEFSKFLKCQETRPEVQMKLTSLLITPIQRIPRYCLLIKQILLYTLATEDDYHALKESLQIVEESAKHIDSLVEERECSEKLLDVQNSLVHSSPLIIKPGRKLIKEGRILKMTNTTGTIMYLVAMTDILMFCKIKKDNIKSKNALKCSLILPLNKCRFTQNVTLRKIHISCENDDIEIFIETTKEFDQWIDILKESHKNIIHNRHTLRKESSSRRPAYKGTLSNYNEVGISPGNPQRKRKTVPVNLRKETNAKENNEDKPLYALLSKRRCIKDVRECLNYNTNDSLYPLRRHYRPQSDIETTTTDEVNKIKEHINQIEHKFNQNIDSDSDKPDDVFVFGKTDNANPGFNFKIVSFFSQIGNSLKRMFRIK